MSNQLPSTQQEAFIHQEAKTHKHIHKHAHPHTHTQTSVLHILYGQTRTRHTHAPSRGSSWPVGEKQMLQVLWSSDSNCAELSLCKLLPNFRRRPWQTREETMMKHKPPENIGNMDPKGNCYWALCVRVWMMTVYHVLRGRRKSLRVVSINIVFVFCGIWMI